MTTRRIVVLLTGLAVAGLCVLLAWMGWTNANTVAAVVSAVVGVATLGATVWSTMQPSLKRPSTSVRVRRTGSASARSRGRANTGVEGATSSRPTVLVEGSGDAVAAGDGDANTGVRLN